MALNLTGKLNILGSMDDNESEDENEDTDEADEDDNIEEEVAEYDNNFERKNEQKHINDSIDTDVVEIKASEEKKNISVQEFLETPSAENFLALGPDRIEMILEESKVSINDFFKLNNI